MKTFNLLIVSLLVSSFATAAESLQTLNFFNTVSLKTMIGLSCTSESDCLNKCNGSEVCQKPVQACLNCVGTTSPYLLDFFTNIGKTTTSCLDQDLMTSQAETLFSNVSLVPIFPVSFYNPYSLTGSNIKDRFLSLCPSGTQEATVVAFTSNFTHSLVEIPMIKCDQALFSIIRQGEGCESKTKSIMLHIDGEKLKREEARNSYKKVVEQGSSVALQYDIIPYSQFVEAQYLRCTDSSAAICQSVCQSSISCALPLSNDLTAKAIANFNNAAYGSCGKEAFSTETLVSYLTAANSFSFNSNSLALSLNGFDANNSPNDYTDINSILNNFGGVFRTGSLAAEGSFFFSGAYQKNVENKINSLCGTNAKGFILGHNDKIERVFCTSAQENYFNIIAKAGESCSPLRSAK